MKWALLIFLFASPAAADSYTFGFDDEKQTPAPEKVLPMSESEKRAMTEQLRALEEKRQAAAPQQFAQELNLVMQQMLNDPHFFADALREVQQNPEFRELSKLMEQQMQKDIGQVLQLLGGNQLAPRSRGKSGMVINMRELEKLLREMGFQTRP